MKPIPTIKLPDNVGIVSGKCERKHIVTKKNQCFPNASWPLIYSGKGLRINDKQDIKMKCYKTSDPNENVET